jgi:ferric-dicitrate binding protein FerR (iron transport regulator)
VIRQIDLQKKIIRRQKSGYSRLLKFYQKAAAALLIPLLTAGIIYSLSQHQPAENQLETIAPRGQKSQIRLSDGTKVWLNSETKIRYPGVFNGGSRDVYLEGEAFFDVTKNSRQPFIVHVSGLDVKVLGTRFNVKAYPDENEIETSLFEGKVSLLREDPVGKGIEETSVSPGESYVYDLKSRRLQTRRFAEEEINGWKKNQLIFKDDAFSNLVRKVERWYDVDIVYDEKLFSDRLLTVELYEGERIERLMEIISLTLSVDYRYENEKIFLTPKSHNP